MQKVRQKELGFGLLGIAMIVTVILFIGFIVVTAYQSSRKQNPAAQNQNTTGSTSSPQENNSTNNAQQTDKYMDIKELAVKIKLDSATQDDTYSYSAPTSNADSALIFNPAMQKIDAADPNCNVNAGYIGMIQRSQDPTYFSQGRQRVMVDNITSFRVNNYYYVFTPSDTECSQNAATARQRSSYAQDFTTVLKTIQKD